MRRKNVSTFFEVPSAVGMLYIHFYHNYVADNSTKWFHKITITRDICGLNKTIIGLGIHIYLNN